MTVPPPRPAARPSGATAIAAGVLSVLGGLFAVLQVINWGSVLTELHTGRWAVWLLMVVTALVAVLELSGGVLLFARRRAGQWLAATGWALNIVVDIAVMVLAYLIVELVAAGLVGLFLWVLVPAIVALVLTLIPPTTRYLTWSAGPGEPTEKR